MPSTLKTLVAQAAEAARRPFDPSRVRRQQLWLLYGGGAAITLFVLVCAALIVRLDVHDYLAQARSTFLQREAQFYASTNTADAMLTAYGAPIERLWSRGETIDPDVLRQFDEGRGRLVWHSASGADRVLALADVSADRPAATYARYLAAVIGRMDPVGPPPLQIAGVEPVGAYLIGLDGHFLAAFGQPLVAHARGLDLQADKDLPSLVAALMPTGAEKQKWGIPNGVFMLDRRFDPVVGHQVVRFARRLDGWDGQPFAWLVMNGPFELADILAPQSSDEDTAIIDGRGNIAIGTLRDPAVIEQRLNSVRSPFGEHVVVNRVGMRFVISDRLPGSSLVMVTTFSWRSVVKATIFRVSAALGLALIAIVLLWVAIVTFDRRALRPANRRTVRLIESEALNRTLIRAAPAGLMLLSVADGETMVRNDTMRAYDEATSGAPLGKRIWQAFGARAHGAAVVTQELAVELAGQGMTYLAVNVLRTRYRGADVLLCTLNDVTARKQVEDKLREAREAADDANRAKSTFLATMSHEIRTPLNAIIGNLELMERAALPPQEARRLKTIMSSSDVLLRMINDVLDLSKVESNQMVLEHVPFDVRDVLRDVVAIFRPLADAKHLMLECRIAPDLADGYVGDPTRLRQIVSNLVSNAIKFTEQGSVVIDARVTVDQENTRCVEIAVRDTGVGIPPEALPTLFDVYIQADPSIFRRFGGTGLGLPLCRRITEAMHGELTVDTRPGEGATFVAALPLPEAAAGWRVIHADDDSAPDAAHADDDISALRVLVAEDHPASRALLRDQFAALGHDATIVTNGIEAMRAYFGEPFDLVLTDLGMPELDGFALANFLREQGATVPVIAMTAHATDEDYRRCAQAGAVEVVLKPLSIDALDAVLRRHGGKHGGAAGAHAQHAALVVTDEIRRTLREATLHSLDMLEAARSAGDTAAIGVELHSMRGGFALAGDHAACDACAEMEAAAARDDALAAFIANWPGFRREIDAALSRLADARA